MTQPPPPEPFPFPESLRRPFALRRRAEGTTPESRQWWIVPRLTHVTVLTFENKCLTLRQLAFGILFQDCSMKAAPDLREKTHAVYDSQPEPFIPASK